MIRTSIKPEDIGHLKSIFAVLTENGWALPEWLIVLEASVLGKPVEIVNEEPGELHV